MPQGRGFAQAAADGIMGYLKGMQLTQSMEKDKADLDFKQEQMANARTDRARADDERRQMIDAGRTVDVEQGAGGMTKPETADNRDVGQAGDVGQAAGGLGPAYRVAGKGYTSQADADAAAAQYNTTDAMNQRQVSVLRSVGKGAEAQHLETSQLQGKAAKQQLEKAHEDFVNEQWDRRLGAIATPGDAATILSGSDLVGGRQVSTVVSADGKKVQFMAQGPDGQQVKVGKEFSNDQKGLQEVLTSYSKNMPITAKVAGLQHMMAFEETQRHNTVTEGQTDTQLEQSDRHQRTQEDLSRQGLSLQGRTVSLAEKKYDEDMKSDPTRVLPPIVKEQVGGLKKTIDRMDTAISNAQAQGQWDPSSKGSMELLAQRNQAQRELRGIYGEWRTKLEGSTTAAATGGKPSYDKLMGTGGAAQPAPGSGATAPGRVATAATAATAQPTAVSAAPAGGQPAPAAAAPAAPAAQPEIAGQKLDTARVVAQQAAQELNSWGVTRRRQDPQGYAAAQQRALDAKAARDAAEADYRDYIGTQNVQPAVRYPAAM